MSNTTPTTLQRVKTALRVSFTNTSIDDEIQLYIDACKADLQYTANIKEIDEELEADALIIAAIISYCKSKFTQDIDEVATYQKVYNGIKETICNTSQYSDTLGDY